MKGCQSSCASFGPKQNTAPDMSNNLNSIKGGYVGHYMGDYYRGY